MEHIVRLVRFIALLSATAVPMGEMHAGSDPKWEHRVASLDGSETVPLALEVDSRGNAFLATHTRGIWQQPQALAVHHLDAEGRLVWSYSRTVPWIDSWYFPAIAIDETGEKIHFVGAIRDQADGLTSYSIWTFEMNGQLVADVPLQDFQTSGDGFLHWHAQPAGQVFVVGRQTQVSAFDWQGRKLWSRPFETHNRQAHRAQVFFDPGGAIFLLEPDGSNFRITRREVSGLEEQWSFGGPEGSIATPYAIQVLPGGAMTLSGQFYRSGTYGLALVRLSPAGSTLWTFSMEQAIRDFIHGPGGEVYGRMLRTDWVSEDLVQIDNEGHLKWRGADMSAGALIPAPEGGVYASGPVWQVSLAAPSVARFDAAGRRIWRVTGRAFSSTSLLRARAGGHLWTLNQDTSTSQGGAILRKFQTTAQPGAPVLHQFPEDQTIREGQALTLEAGAEGTAPLKYKWFFDGRVIGSGVESKLTLPSRQFRDGGSYWVEVSNAAGTVASPVANIEVLAAPVIVRQPAFGWYQRAGRAVVEVRAEGTPPFTYQWCRDGQLVEARTNAVFATILTNAGHAGVYHAVVRNSIGETRSEEAYVNFTRLETSLQSLTFTGPVEPVPLQNGALAPGPQGAVWVTGSNGTLLMGADGARLWESREVAGAELASDSQGNAWILGSAGLQQISPEGRVLQSKPGVVGTALAVARDGSILLAGTVSTNRYADYRVQVFDPAGSPVREIVFEDEPGQSGFRDGGPEAIAAGPQGGIIVGGRRRYALFVFASDGSELWRRPVGRCYDFEPRGIAVNSTGDIYVVSSVRSGYGYEYPPFEPRLSKFNPQGRLLWEIEVPTYQLSFQAQSASVALDSAGRIYVTTMSTGAAKLSPDGDLIWRDGPLGSNLIVHPETGTLFTLLENTLTRLPQAPAPPALFLTTQDQSVDAGADIKLEAIVEASPPAALQWRLNGERIAGATNQTLALPPFKAAMQGRYVLEATNKLGVIFSRPVRITLETRLLREPRLLAGGALEFWLGGDADRTYLVESSPDLQAWVEERRCTGGTPPTRVQLGPWKTESRFVRVVE